METFQSSPPKLLNVAYELDILFFAEKNTTSYTNMLRIYGQNGSSTELTEVGKGQHSVLVQVKRFIGPFQESSTVPLGCSKPSVPVCTYYVLQSL